ncbi:MAG: hypothetical protein JO197_09840 [Acidobacteria bacterium]|nr:hypothetical protein [Acidobacteriota bacterium]MBV9477397.1 hypothetical protein [Acidobacteriota bacterium]
MDVRPDVTARDPKRFRAALLLGIFCLLIYNANRRAITAGDTYPARYLPFVIWKHHTLFLEPIEKLAAQGRGTDAFWLVRRPNGHIISLYPVVVPVLVAPLYLPAVAYLDARGWTDARLDHVARVMEKLTASLLAALTVALLYLLLRRRTNARTALLLAVAYGFGTTAWVICSQALWQHGVAQLLIVGLLLQLTAPCTTTRALAAGVLCGLVAGNRPPDVVLAGVLGVYALVWAGRRRAWLFVAAAALPLGLVLLYNIFAGGNVGGGYGVIGTAQFFSFHLLPGVAGLLFSPARGLFVFSPFLLFVLVAFRHLPRSRDERWLTLAMSVGIVIQLLLYAKVDWRAGFSWGPRYMTDLVPLLMWMLVPVVASLRRVGRACFVAAVGVAILIETVGAFAYSGWMDLPLFTVTAAVKHPEWTLRNAPFVAAVREGLAPAELFVNVRGSFDGVVSGGRATSTIFAGDQAAATGWALAGHRTPPQVAITVDGRQTFSTATFVDRPDVRAALHETSRAGWRIPFDTTSLTIGEHRVTAFAWADARGDGCYLDEHTFRVLPRMPIADVSAAGDPATAAARLREHQQPGGYWLTRFTSAPRFEDPHPEMNTFLTALLVDLLDPIAAKNGLAESVQHARQHLTKQIERGGLVRYHGRPDGPGIGTLGCVITPDTDDTSLVWRVAPGADRSQLDAALETIARYRTPEGLYRSWLAPQSAYQCLDPGSDPNPTDVAIQMHLLLLLSQVRPAAGHALCEALRPVIDEDRVWVYYRKAPLVPVLRLPDLHRAGCDLELPETRMHTEIPGQQVWLSAARLLGSAPSGAELDALLRKLARNDFAAIRLDPPLFYHNDLTATVPRYYWSEDVGYALWLRLYDRYERLHDRRNDG